MYISIAFSKVQPELGFPEPALGNTAPNKYLTIPTRAFFFWREKDSSTFDRSGKVGRYYLKATAFAAGL